MATAATLAPTALDICDEFACRDAVSHTSLCRCACKGAGHGVNRGHNHRLVTKPAITTTARTSRLAQAFTAAADDLF